MQRPSLLLISQVYVPDPASVGQHLHDAAAEVAGRGYGVRVVTSSRGYDAPERRFPLREQIDGVDVVRSPLSSFGKWSILVRLIGQLSFLAQAVVRGLCTPKLGAILVSTSPPMCAAAALVIAAIRRVPIVYWVMDINPDQAVTLGVVKANSPLVRLFDVLNRAILARAKCVVTLDRFMAERLAGKCDVSGRLEVFPPWPHEDQLDAIPPQENRFRKEHRLDGKFVVMYSGNHSRANPISTVIAAAERLRNRRDVVFMFVGGGTCKQEVTDAIARGADNIVSLPYQPMSALSHSLSAADLHVVSIGNSSVGIVHPCKVYGAMAVARPILAVGPNPSHVSEVLQRGDVGRQVDHGDVDATVDAIVELAQMDPAERAAMGRRAREIIRGELSKQVLCTRLGDLIEAALCGRPIGTVVSLEEERRAREQRSLPGADGDKRRAA